MGEIEIRDVTILSANEVMEGVRAAEERGYRRAIAVLRAIADELDSRGGNWTGVLYREAVTALESRLTEGSGT